MLKKKARRVSKASMVIITKLIKGNQLFAGNIPLSIE